MGGPEIERQTHTHTDTERVRERQRVGKRKGEREREIPSISLSSFLNWEGATSTPPQPSMEGASEPKA